MNEIYSKLTNAIQRAKPNVDKKDYANAVSSLLKVVTGQTPKELRKSRNIGDDPIYKYLTEEEKALAGEVVTRAVAQLNNVESVQNLEIIFQKEKTELSRDKTAHKSPYTFKFSGTITIVPEVRDTI